MALVWNGYGKARVRMLRLERRGDTHEIKDLTIRIRLEGAFESAYRDGDNSQITPTDTMKNTVYALARGGTGEIEEFGARLVSHFLRINPAVSAARVELSEYPWSRIPVGGKPHGSAFLRSGGENRTATVAGTRESIVIRAGIEGLVVLKSSHSGFEGFRNDLFTTLQETSDRIFATAIQSDWLYSRSGLSYGTLAQGIRRVILETFAEHDSRSVQHTLHAMGEAVLAAYDDVAEIHFSLPDKRHILVNLDPFGLRNDNEIFLPTEEPHSLFEATLRR
ncbi:MAG TPA: urate oxidase [Methylomirabilota bacterium]|jgi:urate oxidase|nr:urate oxidase [Methylomirabilota bacterium]